MNIKEGFKRIFLVFGYAIFILISFLIASNEGNYYTSIFGAILGFYIFKGLCFVINWIIEGFNNKE